MAKPTPPQLAPKPGNVMVMRAMYPYTAQQADELSFNEGDILFLVDKCQSSDWWKARCGNKCGLIPSNYVEFKADTVSNPVHDASRRGNFEFLRDCLQNGVSPTGLDASGNSPIHWSSRGGHLDCLQELLVYAKKQFHNPGRFINAQNKLGDTPLHLAASKDHEDVVQVLLDNGANPSIKNKENQVPIDLSHSPAVKTILNNWTFTGAEEQADEDYLEESDNEEDTNF